MAVYHWVPSATDLARLADRGFQRSVLTSTRWVRYDAADSEITAWVDVKGGEWRLTTFSPGSNRQQKCDTLGFDLETLLVFATVEGWL